MPIEENFDCLHLGKVAMLGVLVCVAVCPAAQQQ